MSDRDDNSNAWKISPSQYVATRAAEYSLPDAPTSLYITMRDGCRLAADVYLPKTSASSQRFPTLLLYTPYYRRFATNGEVAEPAPAAARYRDFFVPRGYALVVVDVRGTGASFGTRDALRSPRERDDYGEVAQWVTTQPWSNGTIGSTGISYVGAAACFLASTGHPAVKAIAPLFGVSDIYSEQLYPGGLLSKVWTNAYDRLMKAMDGDRREMLSEFTYYTDPGLRGPAPVDDDENGSLLASAIREHQSNFSLHDAASEFAFRDEGMIHDPSLSLTACSPYHYLAGVPANVPIYSVSGWFDGAGYSNGAITRFLTRQNAQDRLLLGPWDHGARTNVSPWRDGESPQFNLLAELLRFFDTHLLGRNTELPSEARVHYFDVHAEAWRSAESWPVASTTRRLFLSNNQLVDIARTATEEVAYQADFSVSTGTQSRYERLGAANVTEYYPDWKEKSASMLHYETLPLSKALPIAGHVVVRLRMAVDQGDASIFVYLSELDADGEIHYMTEGMLRAIHRKESETPAGYVTSWPFRAYRRAEARPLLKSEVTEFVIPLLPIAWTLPAGSKLRLSIAGADYEHFVPMPYGRPPIFTVQSGSGGTTMELPVANR